MQIIVRDNNVEQALRALKKKLQREGVYREMKLRRHYEKPSEKRARERAAAIRRARKLERKRAEREGTPLSPSRARPVSVAEAAHRPAKTGRARRSCGSRSCSIIAAGDRPRLDRRRLASPEVTASGLAVPHRQGRHGRADRPQDGALIDYVADRSTTARCSTAAKAQRPAAASPWARSSPASPRR